MITEKVRLLERHRTLDAGLLAFYVEKLVTDILDYCHRADFPEPLVYSAVDLIRKRLADEDTASDELGVQASGPLSSVKMDDTEFRFAVSNIDPTGCLADLDFAALRPKLNRWRKVVSLP
nr:MAG TPA: tail connector protein [Caudoviricetes sp.]